MTTDLSRRLTPPRPGQRNQGQGSPVSRGTGQRAARSTGLALAAAFLFVVLLAVVWPTLFAHQAPDAIDPAAALQSPSAEHVFGTDQLGRDTFSRIVHGARLTLSLGLTATALGFAAGMIWGLLAALSGRAADEAAMRLADVFLSVPSLLMVLLVVTVLGPGEGNAALAVAIGIAPGFARLVRAQGIVIRNTGYVAAATVLGLRRRTIVLRHIVPNVLPPLSVYATLTIGSAIIVGTSLSFLGLGPEPPAAEWGLMLAEAREFLQRDPLLAVYPGLAITLTVVSIATLGRELQLRFEGRSVR